MIFFGDNFQPFNERPGRSRSQQPLRVGTGSGVIIGENGYIVTNNHVVANADDLEVTLHDNQTFKATIVGTDPSTDLALIQIKANNLPVVEFFNSDAVHVGEWVMAVGNPMGLTSTVTAGIVSAKGRNINILRDRYAVENFIQTDAAINPGNSGGALVNLEGKLVGINTAIASPTGSFAGYGFAVPANIVAKVVDDLKEFGVVQRGVLGIMIRTIDGNLARAEKLSVNHGVLVDSIMENSAAGKAGLREGDIIIAVNNIEVKSSPELQGRIAQHRPGEEVSIKILRKSKKMEFQVTLNNREGKPALADKENLLLNTLGLELEEIDEDTAAQLDIDNGVKVMKIFDGIVQRQTNMEEGFIITHVNQQPVNSIAKFEKLLNKEEGVLIEGIYSDIPGKKYYAVGLQ